MYPIETQWICKLYILRREKSLVLSWNGRGNNSQALGIVVMSEMWLLFILTMKLAGNVTLDGWLCLSIEATRAVYVQSPICACIGTHISTQYLDISHIFIPDRNGGGRWSKYICNRRFRMTICGPGWCFWLLHPPSPAPTPLPGGY
jgi:hypothetical protein